jgi:DNA-binding response OmpR family regulator
MTATALNRILVIEDDRDLQNLLRISLEGVGGFNVKVCGDGREALSMADHFLPDLILLDLTMPNWNGITVLKVLRKLEKTAKIPVVFLTGHVETGELKQYFSLGVLDIIPKPFNPRTLPTLIKTIWTRLA